MFDIGNYHVEAINHILLVDSPKLYGNISLSERKKLADISSISLVNSVGRLTTKGNIWNIVVLNVSLYSVVNGKPIFLIYTVEEKI